MQYFASAIVALAGLTGLVAAAPVANDGPVVGNVNCASFTSSKPLNQLDALLAINTLPTSIQVEPSNKKNVVVSKGTANVIIANWTPNKVSIDKGYAEQAAAFLMAQCNGKTDSVGGVTYPVHGTGLVELYHTGSAIFIEIQAV